MGVKAVGSVEHFEQIGAESQREDFNCPDQKSLCWIENAKLRLVGEAVKFKILKIDFYQKR